MSLGVLRELFDYNYWARDRKLQACAGLNRGAVRASTGRQLSFTARHPNASARRGVGVARTLAGRIAPNLAVAREFTVAGSIPALACGRERNATVPGGRKRGRSAVALTCVWHQRKHVDLPAEAHDPTPVQHQSYHRGQVTALLRQLGLEPPKVGAKSVNCKVIV
jgi:DinB family protein